MVIGLVVAVATMLFGWSVFSTTVSVLDTVNKVSNKHGVEVELNPKEPLKRHLGEH